MFLIVDGSALLTTHYYGSLPEEIKYCRDKEKQKENYHLIKQGFLGEYVNGVESSLYCILDLLENNPIEHMVVCFDKTRETFRKELYAEYKNHRDEKPEPLKQQFDTLQKILHHIGIKVLASDRFEADDLAGSVIEYFKNPFEEMYFITKDHDWFQLVDDKNNVKGLMIANSQDKADEMRMKYDYLDENNPFENSSLKLPSKMVCFDERAVKDTEGVQVFQIPDKKGFAGDNADNIPGVCKIGNKTATVLLSKYNSLEDFYEKENLKDVNSLKQELGLGTATINHLVNGKSDAFLSKKLATIVTDCKEISKNYEDYQCRINKEVLQKVIEYYNLNTLERFLNE